MAIRCGFCGRNFNTQNQKQEHELIHLSVTIQCDQCSKSFSNRANLYKHKRQNHSVVYVSKSVNTLHSSNGNQYQCGECGSIYATSEAQEYYKHTLTHL